MNSASSRRADLKSAVSQVFNLPALQDATPFRLQIGDTSDYKSASQFSRIPLSDVWPYEFRALLLWHLNLFRISDSGFRISNFAPLL